MKRYFFHLVDHSDVDVDVDIEGKGRELPDRAAAIAAATDEMREFLADQVRSGYLDFELRIEITDDSGRSVATVHGNEVVELRE
jgi:hypothetical protein